MSNQYKTDEFLALQRKWYKKLASDGFDDVEQDDDHLKLWSAHFFKVRHNEVLFSAKEDYYRLAGQFLHDYKFVGRTEKLIWELHASGISIREIVVTLKQRRIKAYRRQVHETIQRLSQEMINKCR